MYIISNVANRRMERSTMGMRASDQFSDVAARWLSMAQRWDSTPSTSLSAYSGSGPSSSRRVLPSAIAAGDSSVISLV